MDLQPIRDEADYRATLKEIESLMDAGFGTPEGEKLEALATLVEVWEREHYPMELPDPIEAIRFVMDQLDLEIQGPRTSR